MDGVALVYTPADGSAPYYFKATWIPASTASVPVSSVALTPTVLSFSNAAGLPANKQFTSLGIRGGLFQNAVITTQGSFTRTSGCNTISCGSYTGLVTAASSAKVADTAIFTYTYYDAVSGSLTDTGSAIVVA
jgi:hypothetical protein